MAHTWAVLTSILKVRTRGGFFCWHTRWLSQVVLRFVYFLGVKTGRGNSCRFLVSVIGGFWSVLTETGSLGLPGEIAIVIIEK